MRIAAAILGCVVLLGGIVWALVFAPFVLRVQHDPAVPSQGYHASFYVYVSLGAQERAHAGKTVTILVQPNNSGTNSDDPGVHDRDAWWTAFGRADIANSLDVVLIVPAFVRPAADWQIYTHALDRDALTTQRADLGRMDLQLIAMVDHARVELEHDGIKTDERFLLQGFSASGMFANRFAALHPDRVKGVAAGSPGGWPIAPVESWKGQTLNYPAGIADVEELTGKPFDAVAYRAMPQLIVMGDLDDNDSLDFRDGWDEADAKLVDELFGATPLGRWDAAQELYKSAGANARFVLVAGVGHDRQALQPFTTQFFAQILAQEDAAVRAAEQAGAEQAAADGGK